MHTDPALISPANPTGIQLTQQERDQQFVDRYWENAIQSGLEYYVAGRFALIARFMPVSANILHHGVELLLKACLARQDSRAQVESYFRRYRHSLAKLWADMKPRVPDDLSQYDDTIAKLDQFEDIRYPEKLLSSGGIQTYVLSDAPKPVQAPASSMRRFDLNLPDVDRLVALIFTHTNFNPDALLMRLHDDRAQEYLFLRNVAPLVQRPTE